MISRWEVGKEWMAAEQDDNVVFFNGPSLRLEPRDPAPTAAPPEIESEQKPPPAPTAANFHFKDGRVRQRPLANDPLFGLFDQNFFRLVDENGDVTNVFKLRQDPKNLDSPVVDYDEIDLPPAENID